MRTSVALGVALLLGLPGLAWAQSLPQAAGFAESTSPPIRVYYPREDQEALAQTILGEALFAWDVQVGTMGFATPTTVNDALEPVPGVRIYLESTEGYAAYAEPITNVPATPATDCAAIVRLSDDMPDWFRPSAVFHGFNHALQMSVDCVESFFAYEQVTVAVELTEYPDGPVAIDMLAAFQQKPFHALDYLDGGSMYHYGAALFAYYLDRQYGAGDGTLLARFWNATAQDGSVTFPDGYPASSTANEPDLLDAMSAVLAEEGVDFTAAFARFSVDRYFVGTFAEAGGWAAELDWVGAEPRLDERYFPEELPLIAASPHDPPEALGTSFTAIELGADDIDRVLRLSFEGASTVEWRVTLLVTGGVTATEQAVEVDAAGHGRAELNLPAGSERVVLVATNLGSGDYDPDDYRWRSANFTFSAELWDCPPLVIAELSPARLDAGGEETITVVGSGFAAGQMFAAEVSGRGVTVEQVVRRDAATLDVRVSVDGEAPTGPRDLTLVAQCGATVTADRALRVERGAGCRSVPGSAWVVAAGVIIVARPGRRRRVS